MSSAPAPQQSPANPKSVELLLSFAEREIQGQGHSVEHFDRKTGLILGFALISVAQIVTALFRLSSEELLLRTAHPTIVVAIVVVGLVFVVAAIFCGIVGLVPRSFDEFSVLDEFKKLSSSPEDIRSSMLSGLDASIRTNDKLLERKSKLSKAAFVLVSLALFCYLVAGTIIFVPMLRNKTSPSQEGAKPSPAVTTSQMKGDAATRQ